MQRIPRQQLAMMLGTTTDANALNYILANYFCRSSNKSKGKSISGKVYKNCSKYADNFKHSKVQETARRRKQIAKGVIPANLVHKAANA